MPFHYSTIEKTGQQYFLSGDNPSLLIVSGIHGDEFGVVPAVEEVISMNANSLPHFLFIPNVSPSALRLKSRCNQAGFDLNRNFLEGTQVEEVRQIMNLLRPFHFQTFITFHEDHAHSEFYLYSNYHLEKSPQWQLLQKKIQAFNVDLLNGIDDPDDSMLNYEAINGFIYWPVEKQDHSLDYWLIKSGLVQVELCPEIPGEASQLKKHQLVECIVRSLLL